MPKLNKKLVLHGTYSHDAGMGTIDELLKDYPKDLYELEESEYKNVYRIKKKRRR